MATMLPKGMPTRHSCVSSSRHAGQLAWSVALEAQVDTSQ